MPRGAEGDGAAELPPMYITAEQESRLVDRLFTAALQRREATLAELDARYYPVAPPQTISAEQLQKSVVRQVDAEMERRRQRRQELDAAATAASKNQHVFHRSGVASAGALTPEEIGASVRRLYEETLARKQANMDEMERRYAFHPEDIKCSKMPKDRLQSSVARMSKPKKTEFTTAEINKIYGL